jgi:cytochrome c551/c552
MKTQIAALGIGGLLALGAGSASAAFDDAKAADVMKAGGCSTCHAVDKKLIGPGYSEVSQKHKGDADAVAKLEKSVRSGSKDQYGKIPMPPTPASKVSDADLHDLLTWILSK